MRVCLFIGRFLPLLGGAEFVVHYLAAALQRQGVEVTVLPMYLGERKSLRFPYAVHQYRTVPGFPSDWSQRISLVAERLRFGFDLIHGHQMHAAALASGLRRVLDVPIVATPHGSDIQAVPEIGYGELCRPGGERIAREAAAGSDALIAVSRQMQDRLIDLGADPERIHLIPHGSSFAGAPIPGVDNKVTRASLGIAENALVTITVGRPSRIKGYEFLWQALDQLHRENCPVEAVMVGAEMEEIRSMASATGVEVTARVAEHLHLPGRVPAKTSPQRMLDEANIEMAAWYGLADVYVCTSFIESFSLTALDAMALGLPVIVPDTVGISDLVRNGENGFIVPARNPSAVAERLRWLAAHRDECMRMGENARETVRSCSWDEIARRHLEVYEMVVAKQV